MEILMILLSTNHLNDISTPTAQADIGPFIFISMIKIFHQLILKALTLKFIRTYQIVKVRPNLCPNLKKVRTYPKIQKGKLFIGQKGVETSYWSIGNQIISFLSPCMFLFIFFFYLINVTHYFRYLTKTISEL